MYPVTVYRTVAAALQDYSSTRPAVVVRAIDSLSTTPYSADRYCLPCRETKVYYFQP
jgi:hypothetical protein